MEAPVHPVKVEINDLINEFKVYLIIPGVGCLEISDLIDGVIIKAHKGEKNQTTLEISEEHYEHFVQIADVK